jgi:hypothetical protein
MAGCFKIPARFCSFLYRAFPECQATRVNHQTKRPLIVHCGPLHNESAVVNVSDDR